MAAFLITMFIFCLIFAIAFSIEDITSHTNKVPYGYGTRHSYKGIHVTAPIGIVACNYCSYYEKHCKCIKNDRGVIIKAGKFYRFWTVGGSPPDLRDKFAMCKEEQTTYNSNHAFFSWCSGVGVTSMAININHVYEMVEEHQVPMADVTRLKTGMNYGWDHDIYKPGHVKCADTGKLEPQTKCIWVSGKGAYCLVRDTDIEKEKFVTWQGDGYTYIRIYPVNAYGYIVEGNFTSTYAVSGSLTPEQATEFMRNKILTSAQVAERKIVKPFKATVKHFIVKASIFDKEYKPNLYALTRYEHNKKDLALESLGSIVDKAKEKFEVESKTYTNCSRNINETINKRRAEHFVENENGPCVEVVAVWHNYDINHGRFCLEEYANMRPTYYQFSRHANSEELIASPL